MSFLNPFFLFLLPLASLPIFLHLLGKRIQKRRPFPWIALLVISQEEGRKRRRLFEILVLLMRVLAVLSIILAFSHPYLKGSIPKVDVVYMDLSYSMSRFQKEMKDIYRYLSENYSKEYIHFFADRELEYREPEVTLRPTDFSILKGDSEPRRVLLVSDLQKNGFKTREKLKGDWYIWHLKREINNWGILYFSSKIPYVYPGIDLKLLVQVANFTGEDGRRELLIKTGKDTIRKIIHLSANTDTVLEVVVSRGENNVFRAELSPQDDLTEDDKRYLVLPSVPESDILIVDRNRGYRYITKALQTGSTPFQITKAEVLPSYEIIKDMDILVYLGLPDEEDWILLRYFVNSGGKVVLFVEDAEGLPSFLNIKTKFKTTGKLASSTIIKERFLRGIELKNYTVFDADGESIMQDQDNETVATLLKDAWCIIGFSINPDNTNIVYHPAFVPLLHRLILKLEGAERGFNILSGKSVKIYISEDGDLRLMQPDSNFVSLRVYRQEGDNIFVTTPSLVQPGVYSIYRGRDVITRIAVNISAEESDIQSLQDDELRERFENVNILQKADFKGRISLKDVFFIVALFALLVESVLLRLRRF